MFKLNTNKEPAMHFLREQGEKLKELGLPTWLKLNFKKKPPTNPRQEQWEKLKELGACLQRIRTEQGLSLKTISAKTLISVRLLKEIESGNLEALPEPIYIRGLLKQFADGLGLNGTEFASEFPTDIEKKQVKSGFILRLPNFQIRPLHLYILYIFLVIFSVKWISYILQESTLETSPIPTQPTALQPSPINSPKSTPMIKKPLAKPVVVEVELKAECRLKIVADGKNIFEGTLPQGTRRTWSANKQLTIETGNAGAVLVAFNKEKAKPLGKPGQVQKVTYTISP